MSDPTPDGSSPGWAPVPASERRGGLTRSSSGHDSKLDRNCERNWRNNYPCLSDWIVRVVIRFLFQRGLLISFFPPRPEVCSAWVTEEERSL